MCICSKEVFCLCTYSKEKCYVCVVKKCYVCMCSKEVFRVFIVRKCSAYVSMEVFSVYVRMRYVCIYSDEEFCVYVVRKNSIFTVSNKEVLCVYV